MLTEAAGVLEHAIDTTRLWDAARLMLKAQLTGPSYDTWVAPLRCLCVDNDTLTLQANSQFHKDWVLKHYKSKMLAVAEAALLDTNPDMAPPSQLAIEVVPDDDSVDADADAILANEAVPDRPWTPRAVHSHLNPRYTFEQFVVGSQNRLCHAVALAISEAPATQYNPFFLYGPAGLGKTHLMHAVGHSLHYRYPDLVVRYVTTEQFTNELIQALATKRMNQFREKYRRMDVLLLDDVQFLEGKERTQEEIFHTFNTLHQSGKQIVLTSDRPAGQLHGLEERLRSRFEWGLMADITPPDLETRVAILQKKAEREGLDRQVNLSNAMLTLIAECHPANVRELEGALNKVVAVALLEGGQWDITRLQRMLGTHASRQTLTPATIIDTVAQYYHLKVPDLKGPGRSKDLSYARQVAIYLVRSLIELSLPKMGELFGGRNHTSIMYALEKVREEREHNAILDQQIKDIQARLQQLR